MSDLTTKEVITMISLPFLTVMAAILMLWLCETSKEWLLIGLLFSMFAFFVIKALWGKKHAQKNMSRTISGRMEAKNMENKTQTTEVQKYYLLPGGPALEQRNSMNPFISDNQECSGKRFAIPIKEAKEDKAETRRELRHAAAISAGIGCYAFWLIVDIGTCGLFTVVLLLLLIISGKPVKK